MDLKLPPIPLENGLDLRQIVTTGSVLQINEDYDDSNLESESNDVSEYVPRHERLQCTIGEPVKSFELLRKELKNVDENGFVNKRVLEEGGGEPLHDGCTVSVAYSGFWEGENEPFDTRKLIKPLVVDLKENGLLPGLQIAIKSMLVGETSLFLMSYKVMYGEMGIPPRIKPKADCVFYIKLIKGTFTEDEGDLDLSEPNTFHRVHKNVKMLYCSGVALYKVKNYGGAIQLFNKGVYILHKCRLADEKEQNQQERLLIKFYLNLAICYNKIKKPLKACTACNELNRLENLWNNAKALFQNAKALRMIGDFNSAEKKLGRAIKLSPDDDEMKTEYKLLMSTKECYDQKKIVSGGSALDLISDSFKQEVDNLIRNFKENEDLCKLTLPCKLNTIETEYIKKVCIRENLFFNQVQENYLLDKDEEDKESNYLDINTEELT